MVPGDLVRREAKRLAGGLEGDAVVDDRLVGQAGKRRVLLALADPVAMDLIGQDHDAVLQADLADLQQVRRPTSNCRSGSAGCRG